MSNNPVPMKSYELINTPQMSAEVTKVAQVAEKLIGMGFTIITGQFGTRPSITVKPSEACRQLESVCTGQHGEGGQLYRTYSAGMDGVRIVWHKPINPNIKH